MNIARCPGQDRINWTAEDIFDLLCPSCGTAIEYFKDDQCRKCPGCGAVVQNPRFDNGCAAWCAAAESCSIMRGGLAEDSGEWAPGRAAEGLLAAVLGQHPT